MDVVTVQEASVKGEPLTYAAYCAFVARAALERQEVARPLVQVRKRGVVLCGRVEHLGEFAESGQWFKVDTQIGAGWFESANVRMCSGDGRCVCECEETFKGIPASSSVTSSDSSAAQAAGICQAGVVAPPDSLTHETLGESSGRWDAWAKSAVRRMRAAGDRVR
jgi:hypothetical protein